MTQYLTSLLTTLAGSTDHKQIVLTATGSFVVPAGVTQLNCLVVGGGGGGGCGYSTQGAYTGGQGGQGGQVVRQLLPVTPGETLTVTIGGGGSGATNNSNANATSGSNTTIARAATILIVAQGGQSGPSNTQGWQDFGLGQTVTSGDTTRVPPAVSGTNNAAYSSVNLPMKLDIEGFGGPGGSGVFSSNAMYAMPGRGGGIGMTYNSGTGGVLNATPNSGAGGGGGGGYGSYNGGSNGATGIVILDFDQPV